MILSRLTGISIQVMGIPVPGLVGEFQPIVDYLIPQIANARDLNDPSLQTLKEITKLAPIVSYLKVKI